MRWRIPLAALLTIAALLGAACGAEDQSTDSASRSPEPGATAEAGSSVEVVASGAEPRTLVEYRLTKGQRQTATMRMDMSMAMTGGGQNFDVSIPTIVMDMAMEVLDVTDDGYVVRTEFVSVRIEAGTPEQEQVAASMRAGLDAMTDITGTMTLTRQGEVIDFDMEAPDTLPAEVQATIDQLSSSMEQMAAPFPPSGVGVGARWTVPQTLETDAMKLEMVSEYHLVRLDEDSAELEYTYTQSAPSQTLDGGFKLQEMTGSGQGAMTVRFDTLVPTVTIGGTTSMVMEVPGSGGSPPQQLTQNLTMTMEMVPS